MTTNKTIIIGLVGLMACGKGKAVEYLQKKYNASQYRFSTILSDLLNRLYLPHSRDNQIKISEAIRTAFGEDILAQVIAEDAAADNNKIVVIDGIRRLGDIAKLRNLPNFVLVEVFADEKIRYERLIKRSEKIDDSTKTFEQFQADHERSTEKTIFDVTNLATEKINNNGTEKELQKQLDKLITKYAA